MKYKVFRQASDLSQTAQNAFLNKANKLIFTGILLCIALSILLLSSHSLWHPHGSILNFLIFGSSSFLLTFVARSLCFTLEDKKSQIFAFFSFIGIQSFCLIGAMKALQCFCGAYILIFFSVIVLGMSLRCFKSFKKLTGDKSLLRRFNQCQFGSLALFVLSSCWFINTK